MEPILVLGLLVSLSPGGFAHQPPPPPGSAAQPPRMPYDLSQEQTIEGTVLEVRLKGEGPMKMVTLSFQCGDAVRTVLAGPEAALKGQGFELVVGDRLGILGAPGNGPEGDVFVARTITKGGKVLRLLDAQGQPVGMGR